MEVCGSQSLLLVAEIGLWRGHSVSSGVTVLVRLSQVKRCFRVRVRSCGRLGVG